jgi:hypothetical protein
MMSSTELELASIAVTMNLEEKLQRMPNEVDEVITLFAETYTRMAELQRVLERTCRRAEEALGLARALRRLHL